MSKGISSPLDIEGILATLERHKVRYVLIGGAAARLHGSPLNTDDVDVTPASDRENYRRLAAALRELDAELRVAGAPPDLPFELDERSFEAFTTMSLTTTSGPLDLCIRTGGYPDLVENAATFEVFGLRIQVASLDDIIRSKTAAGRDTDLIALPLLHKLRDRVEEIRGGRKPDPAKLCATLCYMSGRARVGIRELRQNLSVYLRRTLAGETLEVTDRGQPVALLAPIPERADPIARLAAEGRVAPARRTLEELGPPLDVDLRRRLSDVLQELREERGQLAGSLLYLDASALVKLVVVEAESAALLSFLREWGSRITSRISAVEVTRTVRREAVPEVVERAGAILDAVAFVELSPEIAALAGTLDPPEVRSLDAIHVASALSVGAEAGPFLTYDARLQGAAIRAGLEVRAPA